MDCSSVVNDQWEYVLSLLPDDLEASALAKLAIRRRREIASASDLLRVALAYSVCDFSLRQTAAWAQMSGLGHLSDVAVLKRLRGAGEWLGHVVLRCLHDRGLAAGRIARRVRVVDATVVSRPGSEGTDWRLHLGLDLEACRILSFELTGVEGGETLRRCALDSDDVVLADRGYSTVPGVASVLDRQGHIVVRLHWRAFPLKSESGKALDVGAALETLAVGEVADWPVRFRHGRRAYRMRLIAMRKSTASTEREQRKVRYEASRKGRRVTAQSLQAAGFIVLLTDLSQDLLPAVEALELYRLRWQIEIAFKRLKSLLNLDRLRAKTPALARTYLYGKLLAAILLDDLCDRLPAFSPWGFPLLPQTRQSLAIAATLA
jgi:hypothetical protein